MLINMQPLPRRWNLIPKQEGYSSVWTMAQYP